MFTSTFLLMTSYQPSIQPLKTECPICAECPVQECPVPECPTQECPTVECPVVECPKTEKEEEKKSEKPPNPNIPPPEQQVRFPGQPPPDYNTDWVDENITSPKYYQVFPIEKFPGMRCFIIATSVRQLILTLGCDVVYVSSDNITFGNYIIPRQTPGKRCNRCYVSDYINILGFMLFGRPEMGIEPIAPKGMVLLEDDALICKSAIPFLEECFQGQYNCILGDGAWMNFYAGAKTEQPDPRMSHYRFSSIDDIYNVGLMNIEHHADWFIRGHRRHHHNKDLVNHMGASSVLRHNNGAQMKCNISDTLAGDKVIINRPRDIKMWYYNVRDNG